MAMVDQPSKDGTSHFFTIEDPAPLAKFQVGGDYCTSLNIDRRSLTVCDQMDVLDAMTIQKIPVWQKIQC